MNRLPAPLTFSKNVHFSAKNMLVGDKKGVLNNNKTIDKFKNVNVLRIQEIIY
jgi:hypothetical protein